MAEVSMRKDEGRNGSGKVAVTGADVSRFAFTSTSKVDVEHPSGVYGQQNESSEWLRMHVLHLPLRGE
jgi:hypothetical protein